MMNIDIPENQSTIRPDLEKTESLSEAPRGRLAVRPLESPTYLQIAIWGFFVVLALFIVFSDWNSYEIGTHYDDAQYVILARSIASYREYGLINFAGEVVKAAYPFGLPLLLSPFAVLFPNDPGPMKFLSLLVTIANSVILFWGWHRLTRYGSFWWGLGISGLYLLSPITIDLSRRVMSEPIFTTFLLFSILLAESAVRNSKSRGWVFLFSLSLVFLSFTRTIGIVLASSIILYLLFARGFRFWKDLVLVGFCALIIISSIVALTPVKWADLIPIEYLNSNNVVFPDMRLSNVDPSRPVEEPATKISGAGSLGNQNGGEQNGQIDFLFYSVKQHFGKELREIVFPYGSDKGEALGQKIGIKALLVYVGFLVSGIVLLGFGRLIIQKKAPLFALTVFPYLAVLLLWASEDPRLMYPIQAQLFFGFFLGVEGILSPLWRRRRDPHRLRFSSLIIPALACLMLMVSIYASFRIDDSRDHVGELKTRTQWLREHARPEDILLTEAPVIDYLYSGLKTVFYPNTSVSANAFEEYLIEKDVNYVLVTEKISWQPVYQPVLSEELQLFLPLVNDLVSRNVLIQVYESDKTLTRIYQVRKNSIP